MRRSPAAKLHALTFCALAAACGGGERAPDAPPPASPAELTAQSEELRRDLVRVADGVYVAIGYGIANSILLVGEGGAIVVDTMETAESAREVLAAFRGVTDLPIQAIIYTHSHPDHVGGAGVFAEGRDDVPVYAQREVEANMLATAVELQRAITQRSMRMYGATLTPEERVNLGIGAFLAMDEHGTVDTLPPTRTFDDRLEDTVAGIRFELVHAPGETTDQLFVWLPDRKILLPGDNLYRAFPNLYTIRGTPYRDPRAWAASIDAMRARRPEILVPSHTRPIVGADAAYRTLTDYRDAIRFVYDQTVRLVNRGLGPDEIAHRLRLPPHLAESPFLRELYGRPDWSARSVFAGTLGWYDGNPSRLEPLAPDEEARRIAELAGGADALRDAVLEAARRGDHQWVLELSDRALRVAPDDAEVKRARIAALRALAEAEGNPNARHWYFVAAQELAGEVVLPDRLVAPTPEMLAGIPLRAFFDGLAVNLDADAAAGVTTTVGFEFTDTDERFTYHVRRGASEVAEGLDPDANVVVRMRAQDLKELLARVKSPAVVLTTGIEMVRGDRLDFVAFLRLFGADEE